MARLPRLNELTPEQLQALDLEIQRRHFSDYAGVFAWLSDQGWFDEDAVPATSILQRRGAHVKKKLEAIKASTEAAKLIAAAAPDDTDARTAAVMSMIQSEMFDVLVSLQEANEEADPLGRMELLGKAMRGIADLSRASISHKKFQMEMQAKLDARLAKLEAEAQPGHSGPRKLDAETLRIVRQEVYGLV